MDQGRAPIYEALTRHRRGRFSGFHVPGHGGGAGAPPALRREAGALLALDLTELPGLDDLSAPAGPILQAEQLAAALHGADRTFFLVNGSSVGIQALLMASLHEKDRVLLPRNIHRSVVAGLILAGSDPVFLPAVCDEWGRPVPPGKPTIIRALEAHSGIRAVLLVHPTYFGQRGFDRDLAQAIHRRGIPILIDEAHGAHLPFHPDLPESGLVQGADAAVVSTHKMGGALTQGAMLHLKQGRLNHRKVAGALRLLQTSSPSYLLLLSLDLARRQLALHGERLLDAAIRRASGLRTALEAIPGVEVAPGDDPLKLFVSLRSRGIDGYALAAALHRRYHVDVEMATPGGVLVVLGLGTRVKETRALIRGVREVSGRPRANAVSIGLPPAVPKRMTPAEAWGCPARTIRVQDAAGCIASGVLSTNPPGVPLLIPGEEVTPEMVEYIMEMNKLRLPLAGDDGTLATITVVDGG